MDAGDEGVKEVVLGAELGAGDCGLAVVLSANADFPLDLCRNLAARPGNFGMGGASSVDVLIASRRSKTSE